MNQLINSTVLSNFASVQRLDLLRDVSFSRFVPLEIYREIQEGQQMGYTFYLGIEKILHPFAADGWLNLVTMNADELLLFTSLPAKLHPGEAACLCIARNRSWGFLTDDGPHGHKPNCGCSNFRNTWHSSLAMKIASLH